ncbi:MAG TPA: class I SAM-dependent methyltransferase [Rhodobacteraceae bacterium]|nr:class I SAM-dependent methyltransferase [Paracoccaceae bacterium]
MTTPLAAEIRNRIALNGPLRLDRYMSICLGHAEHGYYMQRDPLGADGDFTTAPEVSQMFGEIIGLWCAVMWQAMGAPARLHLVELGPGRGTLMRDALRAIKRAAPACMAALDVHLVETSPVLRQKQAEALKGSGLAPAWHDNLESLPSGPALFLANEFFDALPIRQFVRTESGWKERLVGTGENGRFSYGLTPLNVDERFIPPAMANAEIGAVAEVSPARRQVMARIAARLARGAGAALIIDYGHVASGPGDTFQAMRGHAYTDPLAEPGLADLTAHVDFADLAATAMDKGAQCHGPVTQAQFLTRLGIRERADLLCRKADRARRDEIELALERLTGPGQMGDLFKVLCVTSVTNAPPPPF